MLLFPISGGAIVAAIAAVFIMWIISLITKQSVQDVFATSVGCAFVIFVIAATFVIIIKMI
jgi:hypothetical protein